ncbi:tyrosine-protein phosphatase [Pseudomonas lopnurensis]|uniref:tyrosine-protein phosphatase n=1 Tax=Pseudomonas lopnurensis TaxID=1477517 RepID=UPI0028A8D1F3|nr:tyrosine-protein phosphatase [Pseudomonas lopnurensis]
MSLVLAGTENFRSLAGLPAHGGRRIAEHLLLRSDQLHQLDAEGWATLERLGVKAICDLRSEAERQRVPNRLPAGIRQLALEVAGDIRVGPRISSMLAEDPSVAGAERMMRQIYESLPGMLAPHLGNLFGLFMNDQVPVLIHCAAGKDRTGFTVAVLLHAFGVPRESILADYRRSARRLADLGEVRRAEMSLAVHEMSGGRPCTEAVIDTVLDARDDYMDAAWRRVDRDYGSLDGYLERHAGLDSAAMARLRERWLA